MSLKVSVVVTCYNLEKDIARCLDSLCRQTYEHLEIIVIDDGSKDNSFAVIQEAAEKDSRILPVQQENSGPSTARNRGIDLATGEYLMFIDGDDYVADTYVQHFIEVAENCDLVIGGLRFIYSDGSERVIDESVFCCDKAEYVEKYYTKSVANRTISGPVNKLYRNRLIKEHNVRFDEDLKIREDNIFVLNFLEHVKRLCGIEYAEYYYIQSSPGESLVSKFQPYEPTANERYFQMMISVIGQENLTDGDIRLMHPMFLNMDIASIRKLYYSKEYTLRKGIAYIRSILRDETFRQARAELNRVAPKLARKYYRPLWMVHIINYLAVKLRR